jgi:hypothetical protein
MLWVRISFWARCTTLCDKVCQWLATGRLFSPSPPVSATNKTDRHDITEILLKVALNPIIRTNKKISFYWNKELCGSQWKVITILCFELLIFFSNIKLKGTANIDTIKMPPFTRWYSFIFCIHNAWWTSASTTSWFVSTCLWDRFPSMVARINIENLTKPLIWASLAYMLFCHWTILN